MHQPQRYCSGCGRLLRWVGSSHRSRYCREGCARGACMCGRGMSSFARATEERRRDAYRLD
jgi:hypothetical protein